MKARYHSPVTGRFPSVDPALNLKRAMRYPQGWNRYSYVVSNPMNYVDPTGEDVSIRIRFTYASLTDEQKKKILQQVKEWYEKQKVGKVYVFDAAKATHGGNFLSRFFSKGYATIEVSGRASTKHTPGTVFAGGFAGLPTDQMLRAISNSIVHETAAHQFGTTLAHTDDYVKYARDSGWGGYPGISERYGTVADSWAYWDPATRSSVTGGPIPVHPEDAATMEQELGPVQVEPPDYD